MYIATVDTTVLLLYEFASYYLDMHIRNCRGNNALKPWIWVFCEDSTPVSIKAVTVKYYSRSHWVQ